MKYIFIFLILISCGCLVAENRALLIGVSHYKDPSWKDLSSDNDIQLLKEKLEGRFKITTCLNSEATHDGILLALEALIDQVGTGDTVFIHFSGHGQQMISDDPNEVDGLDEAFIPYDAFSKYIEDGPNKYHGEKHLRDDEISARVNRIRRKLGESGFVVVSVDACHSAGFNRGSRTIADDVIIRSKYDRFGPLDRIQQLDGSIYRRDTLSIEKEGADVVYISACLEWEVNSETRQEDKGYGSLSFCLAKALEKSDMNEIGSLLENIRMEMFSLHSDAQTPTFINSMGYPSLPQKLLPQKKTKSTQDESQIDESYTTYIVWGGVIILCLIIALICYGKRKKK